MATIPVEAGSALASSIQSAAQAKLMENGWAAEENDTTLSEYVTMMLVNGKDVQSVQAELGGELLGIGEDDPGVMEFTRWLFDQVQVLGGQSGGDVGMDSAPLMEQAPSGDASEAMVQDETMGESGPVEGVPSGPKAMRNGDVPTRGRGRGGRMLGQMNRNMDRSQDDPLRRIKGAASGQTGRIDSHPGRAPRGPRGANLANGMQRMMSPRGGRGGMQNAMGQINPIMQQNGPMGQLDPTQQMAFMQMMEMQANMMANMLQQSGGQLPGQQAPSFHRGRGGKSLADRMSRGGNTNGHFKSRQNQTTDTDSNGTMDLDKPLTDTRGSPFDTMCKFNHRCTNPDCPFAHQSPANTRPNLTLDMSDTCTFGAACKNNKCMARHPSPAQRSSHLKTEVDCKFWPNCNMGAACPFKHPDAPPCRNGGDCKVEGCTFSHSRIQCRYNPCTNKACVYQHGEGQKRGKFEDKVWTAEGDGSAGIAQEGGAAGKSERFSELKQAEGQAEELILPGNASANGQSNGTEMAGQAAMETAAAAAPV